MNKIEGSHESTLVLKKGKKLRKIKGTYESTLVLEIGKSLGKIGGSHFGDKKRQKFEQNRGWS